MKTFNRIFKLKVWCFITQGAEGVAPLLAIVAVLRRTFYFDY